MVKKKLQGIEGGKEWQLQDGCFHETLSIKHGGKKVDKQKKKSTVIG